MQGDNAALTIERQLGLAAFIDTGCMACHYGPSLGGDEYEDFNTPRMLFQRPQKTSIGSGSHHYAMSRRRVPTSMPVTLIARVKRWR